MTQKKTRRKNLRLPPERGRPIRIDINGENFLDIVYATDISIGGACIAVPHRFEGCRLDKLVSLVINLPEPVSTTFTALGSIRHLSGRSFGVRFVGMEKKDEAHVKDYIMHLLAQQDWKRATLFRWGLIR